MQKVKVTREHKQGAAVGLIAAGLGLLGIYFVSKSKTGSTTTTPTTTTPTTTPTGSSAPKYSFSTCPYLQNGTTSTMVRDLQTSLTFLGYNPSSNIDGIFGPITEQSVKNFQSAKGIVVDGIVGRQTYTALSAAMSAKGGAWVCGTMPAQIASGGGSGSGGGSSSGGGSGSSSATSWGAPDPYLNPSVVPKLSFTSCPLEMSGSSGGYKGMVAYIQYALAFLGYNPKYNIDGIFGPVTTSSVRSFQSAMHISVDGIVGPQTYGALNTALQPHGGYFTCGGSSSYVGGSGSSSATSWGAPDPYLNPNVVPKFSFNSCPLEMSGSSGGYKGMVAYIQCALAYLGYNQKSNIDGSYGPLTVQAVRSFQSAMRISVDGVTGPQTYGALNTALQAHGGYFMCGVGTGGGGGGGGVVHPMM